MPECVKAGERGRKAGAACPLCELVTASASGHDITLDKEAEVGFLMQSFQWKIPLNGVSLRCR